ncbi:MAG: exodeoxyribonuclease III [Clostridia bacterium]|nr:exodeoxyribonuclease III [Clostridia bacterium]
MKLISWNVNGLRACLGKGFADFLSSESPDIFALQETKLQPDQVTYVPDGYHTYYFSAQKKGYSGTAVFTRQEPQSVRCGIGDDRFDSEGRTIMLEYPAFTFVTAYAPNAQEGLKRLDFRTDWEHAIRAYLCSLAKQKPVIYCGDLNVAHREIDLKNPGPNRGNAGFSDEERALFSELLDAGFVDTFRCKYPDLTGAYSWWSYRFRAREHNAGWRIDYFLVRKEDAERITDALIYSNVYGSDHCPVGLIWEGTWN